MLNLNRGDRWDLENFTTYENLKGIDLKENMRKNILDTPIGNLVDNMVNNGIPKMDYEFLNPDLVNFLNEYDTSDVRDFHQNQFMSFDSDLSDDVLSQDSKIKVKAKQESIRKTSQP